MQMEMVTSVVLVQDVLVRCTEFGDELACLFLLPVQPGVVTITVGFIARYSNAS